MRIVHTTARYYPYVGGVERVVQGIAAQLARRGHEVTVLCAAEPGGGPTEVDGVRIERLPFPAKLANTNITPSLPWRLLCEPFDVVHAHLPTPWSADWSVLVGRLRGKATVLTYYNDIVGQGSSRLIAEAYNSTALKLTLQLAQRIVVNSPLVLERPGSPLAAYRSKVVLIPNGVDTVARRPRPESRNPRTIGFLSLLDEFHRYKGLDVLLEAMKRLAAADADARLLVGGGGSLLEDYRRFVARLGLERSVEFLGFIPEERLSDFFNRCSLFVLPSTDSQQEGFGLVALEAMACSVPVVVSQAAGVAPLLDEARVAAVVPAGDPQALSAAILNLLNDPAAAQALGVKARTYVERHLSWDAIAGRLEEVYEGCLRGAVAVR